MSSRTRRGQRAGLAAFVVSATVVAGCYVDRQTYPAPPYDAGPGIDASLPPFGAGSRAPFGGGGAGGTGGAGATGDVTPGGGPIALDEDAGVDASERLGPRIAFFGDQGASLDAQAVLQLIVAQKADAIVHLGDFDYYADPDGWFAMLDANLDPALPYLAVVGNHDLPAWEGDQGYQAGLAARLARAQGVRCEGETGWRARCDVLGVTVLLSGVGTYGDGHEAYLREQLETADTPFRICAWHKNQHDMQVGAKGDEVGWEAYRICQAHGALVVSGHEHSYARTYTLADVGNAVAGHGRRGAPDLLRLSPGTTAVVVSGLGGHSTRAYLASAHDDDTWWASIYARGFQRENGRASGRQANIAFGALFVDFGVDGDPHRARGYFATVDGRVADRFDVVSEP